ncbi:MAG: hypothetical protein JXA46_18840 [Dehalococcoidales bacterium]|nr:hypothetical protein [Dehalococcoidales bacterium]
MSLAIGHFAAGASTAFLVLNIIPPRIRRKLPDAGFVGIFAGLWAMIPDVSKFTARLRDFHDSIWANFFFFHRLMDIYDTRDSMLVTGLLIALMFALMAILWIGDFWLKKEN